MNQFEREQSNDQSPVIPTSHDKLQNKPNNDEKKFNVNEPRECKKASVIQSEVMRNLVVSGEVDFFLLKNGRVEIEQCRGLYRWR